MREASNYHLDVTAPDPPNSRRRRSPSNDRAPSRRRSTSRDRSPRRSNSTLEHRLSEGLVLPEVTKAKLCFESFFYGNHYEGPYGRHIAIIIHIGNGMLALGLFTAVFSFIVFKDVPGMDGGKVAATILLTLGFATSLSTATVYGRAYKSNIGANVQSPSGRVNLHSRDILYQATSVISVVVMLIGIVLASVSFGLENEYSVFAYLKIVGLCYVIFGLIAFGGITAYSRIYSTPDRSRNRFRPTQPRSRANSHVPQIRVGHDAGSDLNGSDIAVSEISEVVTHDAVLGDIPVPPPYTRVDPNPNYSDTGSTAYTVSAAHSLVTLLQFAYADELQTPSPPPPYEEVDRLSQAWLVSSSENPFPTVHQQESNANGRFSASPVSLTTHSQPSGITVLEITRTESGLTVPDL